MSELSGYVDGSGGKIFSLGIPHGWLGIFSLVNISENVYFIGLIIRGEKTDITNGASGGKEFIVQFLDWTYLHNFPLVEFLLDTILILVLVTEHEEVASTLSSQYLLFLSTGKHSWKNKNKYSEFNKSKLMSFRGH